MLSAVRCLALGVKAINFIIYERRTNIVTTDVHINISPKGLVEIQTIFQDDDAEESDVMVEIDPSFKIVVYMSDEGNVNIIATKET
jgi:hypothetical protein